MIAASFDAGLSYFENFSLRKWQESGYEVLLQQSKVPSGMLKLWIIEVVRVWSFFKVCILAKNTYMLDAKTNKQFTRQILGKVY